MVTSTVTLRVNNCCVRGRSPSGSTACIQKQCTKYGKRICMQSYHLESHINHWYATVCSSRFMSPEDRAGLSRTGLTSLSGHAKISGHWKVFVQRCLEQHGYADVDLGTPTFVLTDVPSMWTDLPHFLLFSISCFFSCTKEVLTRQLLREHFDGRLVDGFVTSAVPTSLRIFETGARLLLCRLLWKYDCTSRRVLLGGSSHEDLSSSPNSCDFLDTEGFLRNQEAGTQKYVDCPGPVGTEERWQWPSSSVAFLSSDGACLYWCLGNQRQCARRTFDGVSAFDCFLVFLKVFQICRESPCADTCRKSTRESRSGTQPWKVCARQAVKETPMVVHVRGAWLR